MKNLPDINFNLSKLELSLGYFSEYEAKKRYVGLLSEAHVWKKGLTLKDRIDITAKCFDASSIYEDNLFSWSDLSLRENTSCLEVFNISRKVLCNKEAAKDLLLIETFANFEDAVLTCNALGGELFFPKNDFELEKLGHLTDSSNICTTGTMIGGKKSDSGNEILDLHGQVVNLTRWGPNKPNGRHFQQCIQTHNIYTENYIFDDISCDQKLSLIHI